MYVCVPLSLKWIRVLYVNSDLKVNTYNTYCACRFAAADDEWHDYQNQFCAVFWPDEPLPPVGDKKRRLRWKAATRQHSKIEAARAALADISITLVPPSAQSASAAVQSTAYVVDLATSVRSA